MQHINQYMAERNQLAAQGAEIDFQRVANSVHAMAAQLFQQQVEVVAERDRTIAELEAKLAALENPAPVGEIEASEHFTEEGPDNG